MRFYTNQDEPFRVGEVLRREGKNKDIVIIPFKSWECRECAIDLKRKKCVVTRLQDITTDYYCINCYIKKGPNNTSVR